MQYLGVLLHQFGEVVEEAVLRPQEVELVVPLLLLHQLGEKLSTVASYKLSSQLHHIQVESRDGGRICDEFKFRRRLLRHHGLMDHLRLDLETPRRKNTFRVTKSTHTVLNCDVT